MIRASKIRGATLVATLGLSVCAALTAVSYALPPKADNDDLAKGVAEMIAGQKPVVGKAGARVTMVGYIDYQCPACRLRFDSVLRQAAKYSDVAVYVEQMQLPMHKLAPMAATLALEADQKGEFAKVHKALLSGQELTEATLHEVAKSYGLPLEPTPQVKNELDREKGNFLKWKLEFVPVFVISDPLGAGIYKAEDVAGRLQ